MKNKASFSVPEGFTPPEGTAPGDTFEVLATVEWSEDGGSMTVTAVEGVPLSAEKAPEAEAAPAESTEPAGFADTIRQQMV